MSKSYTNLLKETYNIDSDADTSKLFSFPFNFTLSGNYDLSGKFLDIESHGIFWENQGTPDKEKSNSFKITSNNITYDNSDFKGNAKSIHCVAR